MTKVLAPRAGVTGLLASLAKWGVEIIDLVSAPPVLPDVESFHFMSGQSVTGVTGRGFQIYIPAPMTVRSFFGYFGSGFIDFWEMGLWPLAGGSLLGRTGLVEYLDPAGVKRANAITPFDVSPGLHWLGVITQDAAMSAWRNTSSSSVPGFTLGTAPLPGTMPAVATTTTKYWGGVSERLV